MLLQLDMGTVMVFGGVLSLAIAGSMISLWGRRRQQAGMTQWTAAALCFALGNLIFGLSALIPELLIISLGNAAMMVPAALIHDGLADFYRAPKARRAHGALICFLIGVLLLFRYGYESTNLRVAIASAGMLLVMGHTTVMLWRKEITREPGAPRALFGIFLAFNLLHAFRGVTALLSAEDPRYLLETGLLQSLPMMLIALVTVALYFVLVGLANQRALRDLRLAHEELRIIRGMIPICAWCKQVRDDAGAWADLDHYVSTHSEAVFSHGICPACESKLEEDGED